MYECFEYHTFKYGVIIHVLNKGRYSAILLFRSGCSLGAVWMSLATKAAAVTAALISSEARSVFQVVAHHSQMFPKVCPLDMMVGCPVLS